MKTFVIEREIPGASQLTHEELRGITSTSNDAVDVARQAVRVAAQLRGGRQGLLRPPGRERRRDPRARAGRRLPGQPRHRGRLGVRQHRARATSRASRTAAVARVDSARMSRGVLIEREAERAWLEAALRGGARRPRLARARWPARRASARPASPRRWSRSAGVRLLRGTAGPGALAYGPVIAALREFLRAAPGGLSALRPAAPAPRAAAPRARRPAIAESDRATLFEAIRCGAGRGGRRAARRWSCSTTSSGPTTRRSSCSPRSPRRCASCRCSWSAPTAPTRSRARTRSGGCATTCAATALLRELTLEPLTRAGHRGAGRAGARRRPVRAARRARCTTARAASRSSSRSSPARSRPSGRLRPGDDGLELALDADVPLPQTIRDAVLLRAADLSEPARATRRGGRRSRARASTSSWSPRSAGEAGLDELLGARPGRRARAGTGRLPAPARARRDLRGRAVAAPARAAPRAGRGARGARRRPGRGGRALARGARRGRARSTRWCGAVDELAAVHAYRDAARLGRQALELWPEGERGAERIAVLERHARFAELAGELAEAARAQREVVAARRSEGAGRALADAERAPGRDLRAPGRPRAGARGPARRGRRLRRQRPARRGGGRAADRRRLPAERRAATATRVELDRAAPARRPARAERVDLRARALGLEGRRARQGRRVRRRAWRRSRAGLSLALEHELTLEAAEVYQRLGTAHEIAGDYGGARDALATAVGFCETGGADGHGAHVPELHGLRAARARRLGPRGRSCRDELRAAGRERRTTTLVADGVLGSIHAFRGECVGRPAAARPVPRHGARGSTWSR